VLTFVPNAPIEPMRLIALLQRERNMRLAGPEKLRIEARTPDLEARLQVLRTLSRRWREPTVMAPRRHRAIHERARSPEP